MRTGGECPLSLTTGQLLVGYLVKTSGNGMARRRMEETKERTSFDGSHRNFNDLVLLQG